MCNMENVYTEVKVWLIRRGSNRVKVGSLRRDGMEKIFTSESCQYYKESAWLLLYIYGYSWPVYF